MSVYNLLKQLPQGELIPCLINGTINYVLT